MGSEKINMEWSRELDNKLVEMVVKFGVVVAWSRRGREMCWEERVWGKTIYRGHTRCPKRGA